MLRVLRQAPFMLRCTLLLYFGKNPSCYAGKVNVQHEFVSHPKGQFTKTVRRVQQGSPKRCWPILVQYLIAGRPVKKCCQVACLAKVQWSWHMSRLGNSDVYIDMLINHREDGPQVEVMEKNRWSCGETRNNLKNVTFFEGVQHAFF